MHDPRPEGAGGARPGSSSGAWEGPAWRAGAVVGPWTIEGPLGAGGMGEVFAAHDGRTGARVAIKTLPRDADPELRLRFQREGEAQARVDGHPHVARVHSSGEAMGRAYLVFELCPGGDLAARLRRGPLPWPEAAALGADLARGLAHAHARGVLHRDLKPENVLFDARGRAKLVDFGLARLLDGTSSLTASGAILGTPAYMAPEQALGRPAGPATDVYGLGAVLYAALTGRPPFAEGSVAATLAAVVERAVVPPSALASGLPRALERVVLRCLAKAPEERYAGAEEVARALDDALAEAGADARPAGRRAAVVGAAVAGALLLGAAAWAALGAGGRDAAFARGPAPDGPSRPGELAGAEAGPALPAGEGPTPPPDDAGARPVDAGPAAVEPAPAAGGDPWARGAELEVSSRGSYAGCFVGDDVVAVEVHGKGLRWSHPRTPPTRFELVGVGPDDRLRAAAAGRGGLLALQASRSSHAVVALPGPPPPALGEVEGACAIAARGDRLAVATTAGVVEVFEGGRRLGRVDVAPRPGQLACLGWDVAGDAAWVAFRLESKRPLEATDALYRLGPPWSRAEGPYEFPETRAVEADPRDAAAAFVGNAIGYVARVRVAGERLAREVELFVGGGTQAVFDRVSGLVVTLDGAHVLAIAATPQRSGAGGHRLVAWALQGGAEPLRSIPLEREPRTIALDARGARVLVCGEGLARVWAVDDLLAGR